MLRTRNKYCSNCLATVRFLDLGDCLVCERCNKRLELGSGTTARREPADGGDAPAGTPAPVAAVYTERAAA